MGIFLWLFFGALAGVIASIFLKTEYTHPLYVDIGIGILGAILGGYFMSSVVGQSIISGFNQYSLEVALGVSILFVYLSRVFRAKKVKIHTRKDGRST